MSKTLLIVDDELDIQSSLSFALKDEGYEVLTCSSPAEAEKLIVEHPIDAALFDVWFPVGDGVELLKHTREHHPNIVPIMMSGHGNIELAIKAIRLGAYDFLEKPLELDKVLVVLKNAIETKNLKEENKRLTHQILSRSNLIGESQAVSKLKSEVHKAALSNSPVLVLGENGSGKELCVRLLHQISSRREEPYFVLNCAAFKGAELEAELFGVENEKGESRKIGRLEQCSGGTLLLDELSSLDASMQARLVQCLQDESFKRVGGAQKIKMNLRLVGGAREDLEELVKSGKFSRDLYYRLGVIQIFVPPLRSRIEDIEHLARHFVQMISSDYGRICPSMDSKLLDWMKCYDWPGNVRELKNLVERILIMSPDQENLGVSDLREELQGMIGAQERVDSTLGSVSDPGGTLRSLRAQFEKKILASRLEKLGGNVTRTAESLGLERAHLHRKLKQYDIHANRSEDA